MSRHCNIWARGAIKSGAPELASHIRRVCAAAVLVAAAAVFCSNAARAAGDPQKGEAVFIRQCALCHTISNGGPNRFGPNLFGIVDRKAGTAPGYKYSPAFLAMANWTWSPDGIASFVAAPAKTIPGNRMGVFQGIAERDEQDLLAYLALQK
jgi:cytochrome c